MTPLDTIYRVASPARLDILTYLVEKPSNNIQELAQLLQRDYANVWRDIKALNSLRVIKLKKEGKEIKPIALYEKITIELSIVSSEKSNRIFSKENQKKSSWQLSD